MALPADGDVRLILSRIRPNAQWGWTGGAANDPANLIWRDGVQTQPTQTELDAEWTTIAAERASESTSRQAIKADYLALVGLDVAALTTAQLKTLLEACVYILGGIGIDGKLLPPAQWKAARELLGL